LTAAAGDVRTGCAIFLSAFFLEWLIVIVVHFFGVFVGEWELAAVLPVEGSS